MLNHRCLRAVLVASLLLAAVAGPGRANTGPVGEILFNVQSDTWPPPPPLTSCDQLVQHTSATGYLEFDLYMTLSYSSGNIGTDELELTVNLTGGVYVWDYWIPGGGTGQVTGSGSQLTLTAEWPSCWSTSSQVLRIAILYVGVSGPCRLSVQDGGDIHECASFGGWLSYPRGFGATAGDICDYYSESCPPLAHCWPMAEMPLRELEALPGETLETNLYYAILPHSYGGCPVSCQATQPWMQVSPVRSEERSWYTVALTVDTAGLEPGTYRGWVQVDSDDCRACTEIVLQVLTATGVHAVPGVSWGRIKSFY